jgi:mRNA interferase MazF
MRRGDIVWVELDPARGSEANGRRPAVLITNDDANHKAQQLRHGMVTVVPVTSNTARLYPFQVLLPADRCRLSEDSKAQAEQIRSVTIERLGAVVGQLPADLVEELEDALRLHLSLN